MVEFSFIIPVYNAGKTIERCLDSIKKQKYNNYEVIIVDDGSIDDSYDKCMRYQSTDNRFKVYRQRNAGPAAARNRCLNVATGKWLCFVDSDDTVEENYLCILRQEIQKKETDVIFFGYNKIDLQNQTMEIHIPVIDNNSFYETIEELSRQDMFGYTWIKCFKRECIGETKFDKTINLFEDEVFACNMMTKINEISVVDKPIYNYYVGYTEALTKKTHEDYCEKCNLLFENWIKLLQNNEKAEEILLDKAEVYVERCWYYCMEHPVKIKKFISELKETNFFKMLDQENEIVRYVQKHSYVQIWRKKKLYYFKIEIANCLKRI